MLEHLPGVTSVALRIKTLRARKIRKLFGENGVGIDKVKYVTCTANDIAKLTNTQIQNIINQVTSKTVSQGNDQNHVISTEDFKSLPETKVCIPSASESITEKALPEKQTHDRDYFRNKILGRYPDIYKEFSSKKFDYYGIIDKSLCPACKISHKDEKSIRGRYEAGSYFVKCGKHEIEVTA
ncbi:13667_t:CDS:1 [Acaulospora colombiana]|uniref:13667_t:CDS:1 n=1 Tax=Acaulospora colombiana TaxID=27376 RepID=A0ACA9MZI7_9GLOM|nr:13667_t:CDS:1 [Acaulospora colombiana]